eukprot:s1130_g39.t1
MDVREAQSRRRALHGALRLLVPLLWPQVAEASCQLRPEQFRSSMVLQGVEFDGAYALSISEALGCLQEVTTPLGPVNQSLHAIADFYEQFYAFRYICIDPAASSQSQDPADPAEPPFDYGVYGTPRGADRIQGNSKDFLQDAKVDLIHELRSLAASLPANPGINEWFPPANTIFARLRDAHVDWRNGGTKADTVLNQFVFILQDDATLAPVQIQVSSASSLEIDGYADARFVSGGKEIESIDGLKPMQWFRVRVLENPAFNYAYKSLGSRTNRMLNSGRVGFAWLGSHMGDVSTLKPSAEVRFKGGQAGCEQKGSGSLRSCPRQDAACIVELLKGPLKAAGSLYRNAEEVTRACGSRCLGGDTH